MMRTRESRPRGAAPEQSAQTANAIVDHPADKTTLLAMARRWRVLRLGCPRGCPLDHHEPPCHLAEEVV
jgi:hypothetical protein